MVLIYLVELDNVWVADQLHDIHLAIYLGHIMTNCQMHLKKKLSKLQSLSFHAELTLAKLLWSSWDLSMIFIATWKFLSL